jgi:hypothetical protein
LEIRYKPHATEQMQVRGIREEHVRYVLESGQFVRFSGDGVGELWRASILARRVTVAVEWLPNDVALVRSTWV